MPLTPRQKEVLDFLSRYLEDHGYAPSLEEIRVHFGMASLNAVHKHLCRLKEKGFIDRLAGRSRSIRLIEPESFSRRTVPLLGRIAAGMPIEAVADPEQVEIPEFLLSKRPNYVLQVEGDSMIDEQIRDGDLIIVEQRDEVRQGETVVALIDEERATLKKFYREEGMIRLQPANPTLQPIWVEPERVRIQGVVVGLMRRY
ncbi:MAG TPA: transcriptional repressor LexA, partial [Acidobacteriota bacterium]|nr:transcriptional repressor LexA [Acidobacteriota bacterium]HRR26162.1 transcriptional repressor LexA [Acidobacteriota bacterium]HRV07651.1 transcriptional repressor LexA [Acidobacteriota bacterium]